MMTIAARLRLLATLLSPQAGIPAESRQTTAALRVRQVIDGDTITVSGIGTVRLLGVDAPEKTGGYRTSEPFGDEATKFMKALLDGKVVRLEYDGERKDPYDRTLAYVYLEDGTLQRELTFFQQFLFPSFVRIDPTESYALVGESSNGHIMQVSLSATSAPEPLAILPLNYDAVFESSSHALVSAATCGFGCGNEIWRVDLFSGATSLVAEVPGASGPLVLDPDGNLYYGTSPSEFPPPPRPSRVIRWTAAELQQPSVLTLQDADVVGVGFLGAARMAIDPLNGDLFLMENNYASGENSIREVFAGPDSVPLVTGRPFFALGNLEFVPGDGFSAR